jgi:hypothetical protein
MAVDWHYREFKDGTQQWMPLPENWQGWPPSILIERVVADDSRRKHWCIVNRERSTRGKYPPKVAGPFKTLEAAKVALIVRYT